MALGALLLVRKCQPNQPCSVMHATHMRSGGKRHRVPSQRRSPGARRKWGSRPPGLVLALKLRMPAGGYQPAQPLEVAYGETHQQKCETSITEVMLPAVMHVLAKRARAFQCDSFFLRHASCRTVLGQTHQSQRDRRASGPDPHRVAAFCFQARRGAREYSVRLVTRSLRTVSQAGHGGRIGQD